MQPLLRLDLAELTKAMGSENVGLSVTFASELRQSQRNHCIAMPRRAEGRNGAMGDGRFGILTAFCPLCIYPAGSDRENPRCESCS